MNIGPSQSDHYEKNVNFLIGAGASSGLFPTLQLQMKNSEGGRETIETLATALKAANRKEQYTALFAHYYRSVIGKVLEADYDTLALIDQAPDQYKRFLTCILRMMERKRTGELKQCNIFTTNYDGCFEHAADELLKDLPYNFCVNDGARGFKSRVLDARNFNQSVSEIGVFGRHKNEIPQINLIHLHGSVYWYPQSGAEIIVDYWTNLSSRAVSSEVLEQIEEFAEALRNTELTIAELPEVTFSAEQMSEFWDQYNGLPIVNPTKWKFHETVFDEHYYQMLR